MRHRYKDCRPAGLQTCLRISWWRETQSTRRGKGAQRRQCVVNCPRNRPRRLLRRGRIRRRGRGRGGPVGRIGSISRRDAGPTTDDHRSADPCHDRQPADPADKIRNAVAFEMPQRFLISWVSPAHRHRRRSHWLVVRTGINVHPLNSCFAMGRCQGHLAGRSAASDSSRVTRGRVKGSRSQIGLESAFGPDRRP